MGETEWEILCKAKETLQRFTSSPQMNLTVQLMSWIYFDLIDELCQDVSSEMHHEYKTTPTALLHTYGTTDEFQIGSNNHNETFDCDHCGRPVGCQRYAAHLEKCMGMGRNSGRIASQRLANAAGRTKKNEDMIVLEEGEEPMDGDWDPQIGEEDFTKKEKTQKTKGKGTKSTKSKAKKTLTTTDATKDQKLQEIKMSMTKEQIGSILEKTCGVYSTTTGKLCERSLKCPAHNDEAKRAIREELLNGLPPRKIPEATVVQVSDDVVLVDSPTGEMRRSSSSESVIVEVVDVVDGDGLLSW
ncbi:ataxin-7-like protein 3 isoform 1 [Planoprotostelium fungivorum]|uniref:Ataxin-7-like protein 3 isoform 1 n=1 Tax=Planoprotostelium fungivorum TaxID=1890364 RepID=A0A2P6NJV4_9EUKA|nr:ataxin-7-like protein 3 isoform 1 [Planoprotostelium fungivorum]